MREKHLFVAGASGSGKTTYLRELHVRHAAGPSVWVNPVNAGERGVEGAECRDLGDMVDAVRDCETPRQVADLTINLRCADKDRGAWEAVEFGRQVGQFFDRKLTTQLIVDECQTVMPDDEEAASRENSALAWAYHEGRDVPIKAVGSTQDPSEVFYPPIKNVRYLVWVGTPKTFNKHLLQTWDLDRVDLPDDRFKYVVMEPEDPPVVVKRAETDPDYAVT